MKSLHTFFSMAFLLATSLTVQAQKYQTKNANVTFLSKATLETIEATNQKATAIIDSKSGSIAFEILIKSFHFEKALMEEHFNEKYMNSDQYPKSSFRGTITNNVNIKYSTDGVYTAQVSGKLTLHGVAKDVTATGNITVKGGKILATSEFTVALADYNIVIPAAVKDKISSTIKITVKTGNMDKMNN